MVWANKMSVVAAGIYQSPIDGLNEATSKYIDKIDLSVDETPTKTKQQSNQELYEEWKALFGKIED